MANEEVEDDVALEQIQAQYPKQTSASAQALRSWLQHPDQRVRKYAVQVLDTAQKDALPLLQEMLSDESQDVCSEVINRINDILGIKSLDVLLPYIDRVRPLNRAEIILLLVQYKKQSTLPLLFDIWASPYDNKWSNDYNISGDDFQVLYETYAQAFNAFPKSDIVSFLTSKLRDKNEGAIKFKTLGLLYSHDRELFRSELMRLFKQANTLTDQLNILAKVHPREGHMSEDGYPLSLLDAAVHGYFSTGDEKEKYKFYDWINAIQNEHYGYRKKPSFPNKLKLLAQKLSNKSNYDSDYFDLIVNLHDFMIDPQFMIEQFDSDDLKRLQSLYGLLPKKYPGLQQKLEAHLDHKLIYVNYLAFMALADRGINTPKMHQVAQVLLERIEDDYKPSLLSSLDKLGLLNASKIAEMCLKNDDVSYCKSALELAVKLDRKDIYELIKPKIINAKDPYYFFNTLTQAPFDVRDVLVAYWERKDWHNSESITKLWLKKKWPIPDKIAKQVGESWVFDESLYELYPHLSEQQKVIVRDNLKRFATSDLIKGYTTSPIVSGWLSLPGVTPQEYLTWINSLPAINNKNSDQFILSLKIKLKDPNIDNLMIKMIDQGGFSIDIVNWAENKPDIINKVLLNMLRNMDNLSPELMSTLFFNLETRDTEELRQVILEMLPHVKPSAIESFLKLLEEWSETRAIPILKKLLQDSQAGDAQKLIYTLANLGDRSQIPYLLSLLKSETNLSNKNFAVQALKPLSYFSALEIDTAQLANLPANLQVNLIELVRSPLPGSTVNRWLSLVGALTVDTLNPMPDLKAVVEILPTIQYSEHLAQDPVGHFFANNKNLYFGTIRAKEILDRHLPLLKRALIQGPDILTQLIQSDGNSLYVALLAKHLPNPSSLPIIRNKLQKEAALPIREELLLTAYLLGDKSALTTLLDILKQNPSLISAAWLIAYADPTDQLDTAKKVLSTLPTATRSLIVSRGIESGLSPTQYSQLAQLYPHLVRNEPNIRRGKLEEIDRLIGETRELMYDLTDLEVRQSINIDSSDSLSNTLKSIDTTLHELYLASNTSETSVDLTTPKFEHWIQQASLTQAANFRRIQYNSLEHSQGEEIANAWLKRNLAAPEIIQFPSVHLWAQLVLIETLPLQEKLSKIAEIETIIAQFSDKEWWKFPFAQVTTYFRAANAALELGQLKDAEHYAKRMEMALQRLPYYVLWRESYYIWQAVHHKLNGLIAAKQKHWSIAEREWLWSLWWVGAYEGYDWQQWWDTFRPEHTRELLSTTSEIPSSHRTWYRKTFGHSHPISDSIQTIFRQNKTEP